MAEEATTLPFRLYDFLAYLFPGAATMHAVYLMRNDDITQVADKTSTGNSVVDMMLGFIAAYFIGLMLSVLTRHGTRSVVFRFCNPRIDYFSDASAAESPLGVAMNKQLREKVQEVFGQYVTDAQQAHRLCRVFVANHCPASWERREAIVGVRSMCANSICPALLYAGAFAVNGWWVFSLITFLGTAALISKMIVLDQREWKEIYFAFLVRTTAHFEGARGEGGDDA